MPGDPLPPRSRRQQSAGRMIDERHQRAAVALEPPCEFELEQNHAHGGGGASGQANKIVDRDRRRPEQCHDARAFVAGRLDGRQSRSRRR
jgi:hypothetical protein